jgi:putative ABC transport system permease protein
METLWQDLRYGARMLLKKPGFTAVVVLTMALGIGANTAIFSVLNAVLINPLPFRDPEQLVMVWEDASFAGFPRNTPAPANYIDWKTQNRVFDEMAATADRSYNLTGDGAPEKVEAKAVSANFFSLLGVNPVLGRTFNPEEDRPGPGKVAVISYGLWQSRYGGERSIIGRDILLDGEARTVVGVMPARFQFLDKDIGLWVPLDLEPEDWAKRSAHFLDVVARIKPGVTIAQADSDIHAIAQRIAHDHPDEAGKLSAFVLPLRQQLTGEVRQLLTMLLVAVGFVLLIACANVASLLLSRAASRGREMAVRIALGASRWRAVRQLLTESLLLAFLGAGLGLLLALWSFEFLQQLIPPGLVLYSSLHLDTKALVFTLVISALTGVLCGLAPALQASKVDLNETMKQGSARTGFSAGNRRLRSALVITEIALALMLLVGAGLLIQTLYKLRNQYSVLQPENVLTMRTVLPEGRYTEHAQRVAFYDQVLERVKHLPGVVSAGYTTSVPLAWKGGTSGFVPEGRPVLSGPSYDATYRQVSADYHKAMGMSLRQGRFIEDSDTAQSQPVAAINETMAREYWPGENAVGKRFKIGDPDSDQPWMTVVGIVADIKQMGLDAPVKAEMYIPYRQHPDNPWFTPRDLVVRTSTQPTSLVAAIRHEVQAVDPLQPVSNVRTMDEILGEESAQRQVGMTLVAAFAALALLLASLGIYSVLSYFVVQHTQEIGVRLALGARGRDILSLVLRKGMVMALIGIVIGLAGAFALSRLMASLLFGVGATDSTTFVSVALVLGGVALLACYLPARRATKVDPMVALRYE